MDEMRSCAYKRITMDLDFRQSLIAAAGRSEVREGVHGLYGDIQAEIDARRPLCILSGRCCHFEAYGHRMFVTTLEMACFYHDLSAERTAKSTANSTISPEEPWDGTGCPFQIGKRCSVHLIRPMGCRIFFCDETAQEWQNGLYERFHARLKGMHEAFCVPYRYLEWREALAMAGLVDGAGAGVGG